MTRVLDYATLGRENRAAQREDAEWLEEINEWHADQQRELGWLTAVANAWAEAEELLQAHAQTIRHHEECLAGHEAMVAEHQQDEIRAISPGLLEDHRILKEKQAEARRAHEEIRTRHRAVVSEVRELLRTALGGAVVPEWVSPD